MKVVDAREDSRFTVVIPDGTNLKHKTTQTCISLMPDLPP